MKRKRFVRRMEKKAVKGKYHMSRTVCSMLAGVFVMTGLLTNEVFAASADPVGAISALKTLFLGILSGIGVIIAAKNGFEMFQAYQQQDSAGMSTALKGVVGGVGMAGIGAILTAIGL